MEISVTEAKRQLTDLIRRAEAGDDVILTRHGKAVVRLVPIKAATSPAACRKLLGTMRANASVTASAGPDAAHGQDFLYGVEGLPE